MLAQAEVATSARRKEFLGQSYGSTALVLKRLGLGLATSHSCYGMTIDRLAGTAGPGVMLAIDEHTSSSEAGSLTWVANIKERSRQFKGKDFEAILQVQIRRYIIQHSKPRHSQDPGKALEDPPGPLCTGDPPRLHAGHAGLRWAG